MKLPFLYKVTFYFILIGGMFWDTVGYKSTQKDVNYLYTSIKEISGLFRAFSELNRAIITQSYYTNSIKIYIQ